MASLSKFVLKAIGAGPLSDPPILRPALATPTNNGQESVDGDAVRVDIDNEKRSNEKQSNEKQSIDVSVVAGTTVIEASQAIWGRKGRWLVIAGLCLLMIVYEVDNTTVSIYRTYAVSEFQELSKSASVGIASTIIFAVAKPPIAKLSNVIGRGATYLIAVGFYILSYVLMASAHSFNVFAASSIFYSLGQSATNLMSDVVIADLTTARYRAFGIAISFSPFLITPWTAGFIVESVVSPGGIGWRWGIGMFAILMPFCASFIIATLLYYQVRARRQGLTPTIRISLHEFCSQIDLGGVILFSGGLALLLIPMTLAAATPSNWKTPWIIALVVLGAVLLAVLPFYEHYLAKHPVVPPHYFANPTISLCCLLIALDSMSFSITHGFLYLWATVARGMSVRDATFFSYSNGVMQCLTAIVTGLIIAKAKRYKWVCIVGATVRLIGYGVMLRLRGSDNSLGELFIVQIIQGLGSGMVGLTLLLPAQIVVTHAEMPQVTALVICFSFVGSSVGSCIAGGIYTETIEPLLRRYLGNSVTAETVTALANSITGVVPDWGTPERTAVNLAFSQVMKYMAYAALGPATLAFMASTFMTDFELPERNNLVE
ncbi:MFS general substrate transporter [Durotheca rogersii]|uniref:MFS general substrate transporter n=1 Tax=Durotheca rogersii TaxID=419775 RepID=UPI00222044F8|nr:MFS general substrate transporter [Durotheca rogersii]KAI5860939.1 MFS general substrate transporter [Durotheca rogersii]